MELRKDSKQPPKNGARSQKKTKNAHEVLTKPSICSLLMFQAHNGRFQEQFVAMMDRAFLFIRCYGTSSRPRMQLMGRTSLLEFRAGTQFLRIMAHQSVKKTNQNTRQQKRCKSDHLHQIFVTFVSCELVMFDIPGYKFQLQCL